MHLRPSRFDARVDALARHRRYRPIEGVQGFTRSHWKPLLGEYSLCIAPDGQRGRMPKKNDKKVPYLLAVLLALSVRRYVTKRIDRRRGPGLSRKPLVDASGRVWRPIYAIGQCFSVFFGFFSLSTCFSAGQDDVKAPNNIGV